MWNVKNTIRSSLIKINIFSHPFSKLILSNFLSLYKCNWIN